jgi:curved DNA-binding protein CbpA
VSHGIDANGYYEYLGLTPNATFLEIKKAYRERAAIVHPDKGGEAEAFQYLSQIYNVLSNPILRQQYDSLTTGNIYIGEFERAIILERFGPEAVTKEDQFEKTIAGYSFYSELLGMEELAQKWYSIIVPVLSLMGYSGTVRLALEDTPHPYLCDCMLVMPVSLRPNFFVAWYVILTIYTHEYS